MQVISLVSHGFQVLAAGTSIGKVMTRDEIVSRKYTLASAVVITADFAAQYVQDGSSAHLSGLLTCGTISLRTGLNLVCEFRAAGRAMVSAGAAVIATGLSVGGQLLINHHYDPVTLLSLGGIWLSSLADYSNVQAFRRRCFFLMGLSTSSFGVLTGAWGLVAKNLISDIGANAYSMWRDNDPVVRRPYAATRNYLKKRFSPGNGGF